MKKSNVGFVLYIYGVRGYQVDYFGHKNIIKPFKNHSNLYNRSLFNAI